MKKLLSFLCSFFTLYTFANSQEIIVIKSYKDIYHLEKKSIPHFKNKTKRKIRHKRESFYVAGKKSKVFHRPDCPFAKRLKSKVIFETRYEAIRKGLRPCRKCKP